jgi:eukaryotic-like serine/threonine-protein kinase
MSTLDPNAIFAARYRIVRCIAAGGMGAVYEVIHLETERRRALKVMHAHYVQSPELRERFKLEARVAAQIDSEFIVDVFDAGIDEASQMPFLVMELLKGDELGKLLERLGRLQPADVVTYLWQTALALDKTHKANIVHRDLKPENLFLTQREDGPPRVKVLDFGVAKFVAETGTTGPTRSLGTPLYMSPEQFRSQRVSPASDIFALTLMAYTLLVGEAYWAREAGGDVDVIAFALATASGPKAPATARAARKGVTLPPAFDAWFAWGASSDPALRPPSATTCIYALGEVFGLSPSRMTGVASSNPLLLARSGNTLPHGSPIPAGGGTLAVPSMIPGAPVIGEAPVIGAAPAPGQTGTGPLTLTGPGAKPSSAFPAIVVVGVLAVGAVVGGLLYVNRPSRAGAAPDPTAVAVSATEAASSGPSVMATATSHPAAAATTAAPATASASAPPAAVSTPPAVAGKTPVRPPPTAPTAKSKGKNSYSQD